MLKKRFRVFFPRTTRGSQPRRAEIRHDACSHVCGSRDGTLNIGSAAGQAAVDAAITGSGLIGHAARTAVLTGDSSGFAGATTVSGDLTLAAGSVYQADIAGNGTSDRIAVWGQGFGSWGHNDNDGNAARLDHDTGGFLAGADMEMFDIWRLGVLAGYSRSSFDADDRRSSGTSDNYHLGLYGGTQWGNFGFRSGLAYSWHRIETGRSAVFDGFVDHLNADYKAGTFQAFGELGYRIDTPALSLEPFAGGDVFTVAGVPIAQDVAVVEAGLDLNLGQNATLGLSYGGQFGSEAKDNSARASFSLKF
ncbi:MAG: autotransporter outer membrane beta-barrel domain-containing protein [Phyllobacterium sp.]